LWALAASTACSRQVRVVVVVVLSHLHRAAFYCPCAETIQALRKRGVAVECMVTNKAIGLFNMLCEEQRRVVAALLTLDESRWDDWR
jgi:uncharacterized protein